MQQVDLNLIAGQRNSVFSQFCAGQLHLARRKLADADGTDPVRFCQPDHRLDLGPERGEAPVGHVDLMQIHGEGIQRAQPVVDGAGNAFGGASERRPFRSDGDIAGLDPQEVRPLLSARSDLP